ncbi:hypothetical protein BIW11_07281 [Tropilaelaps mercedesae]|uniref:Uncharacterized protein n=1 Tax=Tropilaelaps mercedesae TaxID=418985 RepID=A0A1V9XUL6_9ACAR|nr:hypothetical protein BIW11_07281 [Tropilaelaps mercedesae]
MFVFRYVPTVSAFHEEISTIWLAARLNSRRHSRCNVRTGHALLPEMSLLLLNFAVIVLVFSGSYLPVSDGKPTAVGNGITALFSYGSRPERELAAPHPGALSGERDASPELNFVCRSADVVVPGRFSHLTDGHVVAAARPLYGQSHFRKTLRPPIGRSSHYAVQFVIQRPLELMKTLLLYLVSMMLRRMDIKAIFDKICSKYFTNCDFWIYLFSMMMRYDNSGFMNSQESKL